MGWFSSSLNEVKSSSSSKTQNYVIHIYKRAITPRCLFYLVAGLLVNWKDEKAETLTRKILLGFFCPLGVVASTVAIEGARPFMESFPQIIPSLALLLGLYITFYIYVAITKKCPATLYHLWVTGCSALTLVASIHGLLSAAGVLIMAMLLLLTLSSEFSAWLYRVIYLVFLAAVLMGGIIGVYQHVLELLGSKAVDEDIYVVRANLFIFVAYIIFILVYVVDRIISRSASGVQEAATFADECCKLLSTYDTKEAASLLQTVGAGPTRLPDKLWESFKILVEDLHLYRAYLPQHVLGSRRTALDNSTLVVPSSTSTSARKMTTVECNTVLLTLQAPDFMSFEEATIFMEAAAGMVSAFKGTVELTSSTVIAASFSTPPPKDRNDKKSGRTTTLALRHEFTSTAVEEAAPEPVWEMVAAEAGKAALDYLRDIGILNVTAVVTSGQLCRTVVEDGDSSSHIVVHGATVLEGVQLSQIRNKRTYMRVIMSEAAALAVCEMVLPTMQIHQQGSKSLLFEYFSMPAVEEDAYRLAIREVFVLIVNGRLESALAGISDAYAAESLSCARWKAMLMKIIQAPQPGTPQTLGLPILYTGGWVPSGVPIEQAITSFRSGARGYTQPLENNTDKIVHQPAVILPPVFSVSTAANLEKTIAQRMRAIVVADDDALFPVFVHEDDSDMEVDEAVRQASHLFSNSGVDTTHSATYEQQPPQKQVTDTSGSTWSITNRVLGGGAFATVWLATNEMGRPVAAKIINTSHRNISSSAHEIISEVETLSSMRHPHIVSYLSWAMVGKDMYVFMEWVGYGSLKMMMDRCKVVPIDMVQKYVLHALSGLIFLHSKGIVHCDVKPHNLLVEANGCVKIADFGSVVSCMNRDDRPVIRRYIDPTQPDMTVTDSTHYGPSSNGKDTSEEQQQHQEMAQVGHEDLDVKGTAWYMAPEACRGDVEAVSDVWSLGITVAELLGGQLPFAPQDLSTSQSRFIQRVGSGMIKPTITHIPLLLDLVETYPQLGNFLRECWEFNPRNRHTANKIQDEQTSWTSQ